MRARLRLEIAYLLALSQHTPLVRPILPQERALLENLVAAFGEEDVRQIKRLEAEIRHDVKAVELYLQQRLADTSLADLIPYLHFGLTSDDINLTALAEALHRARGEVLLPALDAILELLRAATRAHRAVPMLARTHGQPAVPTTFGKEMAVFLARLERQRKFLAEHRFAAKWSGAVGNYNAMQAAAPEVDWPAFATDFLKSLGLEAAPLSTQIIPYENWLEFFQVLQRINGVLLDLCRDMWLYISRGLLRLKVEAAEVGSSTMPQKVNPIDFENAEGNLGLANALLAHYVEKLSASRLQRDLSDSTVRRSFGEALGHTLVAWKGVQRGLRRTTPDVEAMRRELEAHWEVIAEGAQTILRAAGIPSAYDQLKALARGRPLSREAYLAWVQSLPVAADVRAALCSLSPLTYLGLAENLAAEAVGSIQEEAE